MLPIYRVHLPDALCSCDSARAESATNREVSIMSDNTKLFWLVFAGTVVALVARPFVAKFVPV